MTRVVSATVVAQRSPPDIKTVYTFEIFSKGIKLGVLGDLAQTISRPHPLHLLIVGRRFLDFQKLIVSRPLDKIALIPQMSLEGAEYDIK